MHPLHGSLPMKATPASLSPSTGRGLRPPEAVDKRAIVATRQAADTSARLQAHGIQTQSASAPQTHLVHAPAPRSRQAAVQARPPFGGGSTAVERQQPPMPPRFQGAQRSTMETSRQVSDGNRQPPMPRQPQSTSPSNPHSPMPEQSAARGAWQQPPNPHIPQAPSNQGTRMEPPPHPVTNQAEPREQVEAPRSAPNPPPVRQPATEQVNRAAAPPDLPGEPANRVYPGHVQAPVHAAPMMGGGGPPMHAGPSSQGGSSGGRSHGGHGRH